MWSTESLWFDTAVVLGIFAVGNILFGHFEEHRPKARRLLKVGIVLAVVLTLSATAGRAWAFGLLGLLLIGAAYIHLRWLPKYGINGWTAEPRDRYLELVTQRTRSGGAPRA
jgi:predicted MFS family arabinose efflux permease